MYRVENERKGRELVGIERGLLLLLLAREDRGDVRCRLHHVRAIGLRLQRFENHCVNL